MNILAGLLIPGLIMLAPVGFFFLFWWGIRRKVGLRLFMPSLWALLTYGNVMLFYERYWRWRDCFNELGRCYDPEEGVMLEQAGLVWGGLAAIFGLLFLASLRRLLRYGAAPKGL